MQRSHRLTVAAGVFTAVLGLLLAIEGGWLAWVGGSPAYLIGGLGYLLIGGLLIARRAAGFWINLGLFAAALIWAFWETGFSQLTTLTALPRLDVPMLIALVLMIPWVWRGLGSAALPALTAGTASLALIVVAIAVMVSMPWVQHPNGEVADSGPHVKLPASDQPAGDWQFYGRTAEGSRYSPLNQITPDNVGKLEKAWSYQSGDMKYAYSGAGDKNKDAELHDSDAPHFGAESTPLKIGSTVYTCTPNAWVVALDADTGEQKWKFKPNIDDSNNNFVNCRGVSYYKAGPDYTAADGSQVCKSRIIAPTMGPYVVALDARTGKKCPGFGQNNGMIDLTQGIGGVAPGSLVQSSAPLVMHGIIVTGGNVLDNWFVGEPSGVVRGWDAETGQLEWSWDLGRDDPNAPLGPGEHYTRYTPNVWGTVTGDPKNGIIYLPLGNATPDYYGKNRRPFDMEYSGSIVALNVDNGHELWHFQEAHTDVWDYDMPIGPSLVQWPNGNDGYTPALVSTNKRGQLFVLNRLTGEPIMPVEEKPVPTGPDNGVLTDWMSKTQPFSPEMPQFTPAKLQATDMWGVTPFDQMWCRAKYQQAYYPDNNAPPTRQGTLMYPTFDGVTDWYGASFSPDGQLNIVANYLPFIGKLVPRKASIGKGLIQQWDGQGVPPLWKGTGPWKPQYGLPYAIKLHPFMSPIEVPCNAPPWATLNQVNLAQHKIEWSTLLGDARHTAPFGLKHNLPLPSSAPSLGSGVQTAGGVTFIAGTADNVLRAYDTDTGQVVWSTELPAGAQATPAIYSGDNGREYIVLTVGGHSPLGTKRGDYTIAWALPQSVANQAGQH